MIDPNGLIIIKLSKDLNVSQAKNSFLKLMPFLFGYNDSQRFKLIGDDQVKSLIGTKLD